MCRFRYHLCMSYYPLLFESIKFYCNALKHTAKIFTSQGSSTLRQSLYFFMKISIGVYGHHPLDTHLFQKLNSKLKNIYAQCISTISVKLTLLATRDGIKYFRTPIYFNYYEKLSPMCFKIGVLLKFLNECFWILTWIFTLWIYSLMHKKHLNVSMFTWTENVAIGLHIAIVSKALILRVKSI